METTFTPHGVCSRGIEIETAGERIENLRFIGGCRGNTAGIAALVKGMSLTDVIDRLKGIECRNGTSCPDQLAIALTALQLAQAS